MRKKQNTPGEYWSTAWGYYLDKKYIEAIEMAKKFIQALQGKLNK